MFFFIQPLCIFFHFSLLRLQLVISYCMCSLYVCEYQAITMLAIFVVRVSVINFIDYCVYFCMKLPYVLTENLPWKLPSTRLVTVLSVSIKSACKHVNRCLCFTFIFLVHVLTVKTSFYRFESIVLSFETSKSIVFFLLSFYRFIVLSFFGKKHRVYSIVLSFYRCKENIEFFYRFIVLSL